MCCIPICWLICPYVLPESQQINRMLGCVNKLFRSKSFQTRTVETVLSFRASLQTHIYSFIRFVSCSSYLLLALIACHKINTLPFSHAPFGSVGDVHKLAIKMTRLSKCEFQ